HHAAADTDRPAAGIIDRAIPLSGIVNDNQAFRLVTGFVASSLGRHANPGWAGGHGVFERSLSRKDAGSEPVRAKKTRQARAPAWCHKPSPFGRGLRAAPSTCG